MDIFTILVFAPFMLIANSLLGEIGRELIKLRGDRGLFESVTKKQYDLPNYYMLKYNYKVQRMVVRYILDAYKDNVIRIKKLRALIFMNYAYFTFFMVYFLHGFYAQLTGGEDIIEMLHSFVFG